MNSDVKVTLPENVVQTTNFTTQKDSPGVKRPRSSPPKFSRKEKLTKLDYWLNPRSPSITSNNKFNILTECEDQDQQENEKGPTMIKPPPPFVAGVKDVNPLYKVLNESAKNNYYIKVINSEEIKIQPKSVEAYETIASELSKRNTEYYSYQKKEDRAFRAVLKNLHSSTDIDLLKAEIEDMGHKVLRINNIRKINKTPLPMFFIDLKASENNKDIYKIQYLMNTKVIVESPRK